MKIPSVSTVGIFLTIALRLAIRVTPSARVTVTTMGRPSGMAATAKLTPILNISSKGLP